MLLHISGDSLAARAEGTEISTLSSLLSDRFQVVNSAKSGDSTRDILTRLDADILSQSQPAIFLLLIGSNDLATHKQVPLVEFKENLAGILASVKQAWSGTRILLVGPPAVDEEKQRFRTNFLVELYSRAMQEQAELASVEFFDFYQLLLERPEGLPFLMEGIMDDGLHFGRQTYGILVDAIEEKLSGGKL